MRPDMGKIAVDAYRHGGYDDRKRTSKQRRGKHAGDALKQPTKASMSRRRTGSRGLGENLAPLYRWLDKQVGRPWDDVYSDLVESLQGGYTNLEHIKGHVLGRVERDNIRIIDGWPHTMAMYSSYYHRDPWVEIRKGELFVDPQGILRRPPDDRVPPSEKRRKRIEKGRDVIMLDALCAAVKIDGSWFAADLKPVPLREVKDLDYVRSTRNSLVYMKVKRPAPVVDALVRRLSNERITVPYDMQKLYAERIRTMSKREIGQRIPEKLR